MRRPVSLAWLALTSLACSQLLGIDDLAWRGGDASVDAPVDAELDDVAEDAPLDAATCDGSFAADPKNCGRCGHDCFGGACDAGACEPATLLAQSGLEATLATDGEQVFFRVGGAVDACSVTGCASPTTLWTASAATPRLVAASAGRVYWNDGNAVYGCDAAAPCGTPATMFDLGASQLTGLAASAASSWVLGAGYTASTLRVMRAKTDASTSDQVVSMSIGGSTSGAVTAVPQSSHVYWGEEGAPAIFDCVSPPCTTYDHDTTALGSSPLAMVATIASVFFGTTGGLWTVDASLANAKAFAGSGTVALVVLAPSSESTVYFVSQAAGTWTLASCPTAACPSPATLRATTTPITALAADDVSLYFIEGGAIERLALP